MKHYTDPMIIFVQLDEQDLIQTSGLSFSEKGMGESVDWDDLDF